LRVLRLEELEHRSLMHADPIFDWNDEALAAIRTDKTSPPVASRALAMLHGAVYDAVESIDQRNGTYLSVPAAPPTASREAAIAEAATRVLSNLFPAQADRFQANRLEWLVKVPEGLDKQSGIAAGGRAADAMLAARSNDGSQNSVTYTPGGELGDWEPTPPALAPPLLPQWPGVRPFAISSGSVFRPGPPPALTSAQYTAAFDEVKQIGSATSSTRTQDQTQIANFWANGAGTATPPGHLNLIARTIAESRGTTLSENARLMAILNLALADAAIACWDVKYQSEFWRPITGIRKAADDGNAATQADSQWTPLLITPNFPSYTSGHATFSGAMATVLTRFFGTSQLPFTAPSENPAATARSYSSVDQAAQESADSRLYGGIHWRFDNEQGLTMGRSVGLATSQRMETAAPTPATVSVIGGILTVRGTAGPDRILVEWIAGKLQVTVNGIGQGRFEQNGLTGISIDAAAGHDLVLIARGILLPSSIQGGDGNDQLYAGGGSTELRGDAGNDFLYAYQGTDRLFGGAGNDRIYGGSGDDLLDGGEGHDWLFGEAGDDQLLGQSGHDWLYGGNGNDRLEGGDGNDRLWGEAGVDQLLGGPGDDWLYGDRFDSLLDGGPGRNRIYR
jgi:hypothetical protein